MLILLLSLLFLALFALALGFVLQKRGKTEDAAPAKPRPEGCCGMHEVCEKESLLDGIDYEPEYYDDEELDAYRHRAADSYTPAEIEQFEEVLTTMRAEEVAGWVRSLRLRGVALPDALRDYVIIHELCHLEHHNHSAEFHRLLNSSCLALLGRTERELVKELRGYCI